MLKTTAEKHRELSSSPGWVLTIQGVILIIGGMAAIMAPQIATLATTLTLGFILFVAGLFRIITILFVRSHPGFWGALLLSLLMMALGFLLAARPTAGVVTLTLALMAYFAAHGLASIIMAVQLRHRAPRWTLLLVSGVLDFLLAGFLIAGWPGTALWAIGLLVGINMIFAGVAITFGARPRPAVDPIAIR